MSQPKRFRITPAALGLLAGALLALWAPADVGAQIRASEPASVMQTIDGTVITIEYFRPKARGRSPLFGEGAVVWEHIWTPGANWSTKIAFEKPITLEGHDIEPGEYSIWMVLSEDELLPHEMILHRNPRIFHTNPPDLEEAVVRVPLEITEAPHAEMLTWEFEDVRTTGATLAMRWGDVRIPLEVGVEPTMRQVSTPEEAAPVVGTWELRFQTPAGEEPPVSLTLTHGERGTILADIDGVAEGGPTWMNDWDFIIVPLADRIFAWGEARDGELAEVWPGVTVEFGLDGDSATSFQIRDDQDQVMGRGERTGG
jgi:hypothetical protein